MLTRNPDIQRAGIPPHINAGLKENHVDCDCGAKATKTGWFVSITGGQYPINNAVFLCDRCADELAAIDPGVTIRPLREEHYPHEVLAIAELRRLRKLEALGLDAQSRTSNDRHE